MPEVCDRRIFATLNLIFSQGRGKKTLMEVDGFEVLRTVFVGAGVVRQSRRKAAYRLSTGGGSVWKRWTNNERMDTQDRAIGGQECPPSVKIHVNPNKDRELAWVSGQWSG